MRLGSNLEAEVWKSASNLYGAAFPPMLDRAISQYRRRPGFDELTRIYATAVGHDVLDALVSALSRAGIAGAPSVAGFVEVRHGLRWHLARDLQGRLTEDGYATPAMGDDLLATDLGL